MLKMHLPILVSVIGQEQEEGIRNEPFLELINASSGFSRDFYSMKDGTLPKLQPPQGFVPAIYHMGQKWCSVSPNGASFNRCLF